MEFLLMAGVLALLLLVGVVVVLVGLARWLSRAFAPGHGYEGWRRARRPAALLIGLGVALAAGAEAISALAREEEEHCRRAGIEARLGGVALRLPVEAFAGGDAAGPAPRVAGFEQDCRLALRRGPPLDIAAVTLRPARPEWRCHPRASGVAALVCALGEGGFRMASVTLTPASGDGEAAGEDLRDLACRFAPRGQGSEAQCTVRAAHAGRIALAYAFEGAGDEDLTRRRAQDLHRDFLKLLSLNLLDAPAAPAPAREIARDAP